MSTGSRAGTPWPPPCDREEGGAPVTSARRSPSAWGRMWSSLPCITSDRAADLATASLDLGGVRAEHGAAPRWWPPAWRGRSRDPSRRSPRSASWSAARRTSRSKKNCRKSSWPPPSQWARLNLAQPSGAFELGRPVSGGSRRGRGDVEAGGGADEEQPAHPIGVGGRHQHAPQRSHATVRRGWRGRCRWRPSPRRCPRRTRRRRRPRGADGSVGPAVAPPVEGDDSEVAGQVGHLGLPDPRVDDRPRRGEDDRGRVARHRAPRTRSSRRRARRCRLRQVPVLASVAPLLELSDEDADAAKRGADRQECRDRTRAGSAPRSR